MITISYSREELEEKHGKVWDTKELQKDFQVLGFLAPHIACVRKSDGVKGSMEFQHYPRFYYDFQREDRKSDDSNETIDEPKTIGDVLGLKNATTEEINDWVIEWAKRVFPKEIADQEIEKFKKTMEEQKKCYDCAGNNHPVGEYCQGCGMIDYRRNKRFGEVREVISETHLDPKVLEPMVSVIEQMFKERENKLNSVILKDLKEIKEYIIQCNSHALNKEISDHNQGIIDTCDIMLNMFFGENNNKILKYERMIK